MLCPVLSPVLISKIYKKEKKKKRWSIVQGNKITQQAYIEEHVYVNESPWLPTSCTTPVTTFRDVMSNRHRKSCSLSPSVHGFAGVRTHSLIPDQTLAAARLPDLTLAAAWFPDLTLAAARLPDLTLAAAWVLILNSQESFDYEVHRLQIMKQRTTCSNICKL